MSSFPGDWIWWLKQPGSPSTVTGSQLVIHQQETCQTGQHRYPDRNKLPASTAALSLFFLFFYELSNCCAIPTDWARWASEDIQRKACDWDSWVLAEDICLSFPISSPSRALALQWEEVSISDREAQGVMALAILTKTSSLRTDPPHQKRGLAVSPHSGSPSRVLAGGELTGEWTMVPFQHVEL